MLQHAVIIPLLMMLLLTALVWMYMYILRLGYMFRHKIEPEQLVTPDKKYIVLPEKINFPAYNLSNLFELPVLFYVLCLLVMFMDIQSIAVITFSWIFVIFRVLHSLVHCTYNRVTHRFLAYLIASIALWGMLFTVIVQLVV